MTTQIKLILSFFSDHFKPDEMTDLIEVQPTNIQIKGEQIKVYKSILYSKESVWEYSSGFIETLFLDELSDRFIAIFEKDMDAISKYITQHEVEAKLFIVIEIEGENKPALFFNKKLLKFVNTLNAEIDIDLYINNQDKC